MKSAFSSQSEEVEKLRAAAGVELENKKIDENYICPECENFIHLQDCKNVVQNWCTKCANIQKFTHISSKRNCSENV